MAKLKGGGGVEVGVGSSGDTGEKLFLKSALKSDSRRTQKEPGGGGDERSTRLFLVSCVQPLSQTTGSHKTEFVFDVRQFGVLQRAQLHFSTPVLYTEQLKTTSEKKK